MYWVISLVCGAAVMATVSVLAIAIVLSVDRFEKGIHSPRQTSRWLRSGRREP
jgi:hypothetical protein